MTTIFRLPDLGEGLTESEIVTWLVQEGDEVSLNQPLAEVETAKAVVEVPSPHAGTISKLHAEAGETVQVGAPLVEFTLDGAVKENSPSEPESSDDRISVLVGSIKVGKNRPSRTPRVWETTPYVRDHDDTASTEPTKATPPVRAYAKQRGVDLRSVQPRGETVTRADIDEHLKHAHGVLQEKTGASDTQPVTGLRKHTAAAMSQSFHEIPHATVYLDVDVTETLNLLQHLKESIQTDNTTPTFLSLVSRAVVRACRKVPEANASFNTREATITTHSHIHLGIAVATPRGLVVVSVDHAENLGAEEITAQIQHLRAKAIEGTATPAELTSSTITISNVGVFGVDTGSPIINPGQSAILALGAIKRRPWEHQGELALRHTLTLSLSFDHRVLDGAEASRFITAVGEVLEHPGIMLVG